MSGRLGTVGVLALLAGFHLGRRRHREEPPAAAGTGGMAGTTCPDCGRILLSSSLDPRTLLERHRRLHHRGAQFGGG